MMPSNAGIRVEEERGPDQCIARLATARTAFVGRTLRGPVNRPIFINNFSEFQHVFGGLWQPSPLGYAVEQFFDNGGREALVVRVVNGARSASLTLRAGEGKLCLRALRPGTREFLRASVDHDNISPADTHVFNLTVQRLRAHGTEYVEDQEIFRGLSLRPTDDGCVVRALAGSELVELARELPAQRPDLTLDRASGVATGYVASNADGDDGAPLSDYDLIGSVSDRTGLFALADVDYFNFLCMPPLAPDQDVGPSALLVGARYAKQRRALMIVDPPLHWQTAEDAVLGMRDWNFFSEDALMYFPRVLAHDKLRGHFEAFAPCGAVAGMLARCDESFPVWASPAIEEPALRPGFRPSCLVSEDRRARLAAAGVNTFQAVRSAARHGGRARTLAAGTAAALDWQYLPSRRLALFIVNCIERGTRWVMMGQPPGEVAEMAVTQVRVFFEQLHEAGAFGERRMEEAFFVSAEQRGSSARLGSALGLQLTIGFAASRAGDFHSFRITHSATGSQVKAITRQRLHSDQYSPAELEWVDSLASQLRP